MEMEGKCFLLNDLKLFLSLSFPELAAELETAELIEEVLTIFSCHTSLINVFHMKAIADYCKLDTFTTHIQEYDDALDQFCKEVFLKELYGLIFVYKSCRFRLQSETIEFTLNSSIEDNSLYDIKQMLVCAFQVMVHHIMLQTVSINGDEISLFCFAPFYLSGELVRLVQNNKDELMKRGVLGANIAGLVVISREEVSVKLTVQCYSNITICSHHYRHWKKKARCRGLAGMPQKLMMIYNKRKVCNFGAYGMVVYTNIEINILNLSNECKICQALLTQSSLLCKHQFLASND